MLILSYTPCLCMLNPGNKRTVTEHESLAWSVANGTCAWSVKHCEVDGAESEEGFFVCSLEPGEPQG